MRPLADSRGFHCRHESGGSRETEARHVVVDAFKITDHFTFGRGGHSLSDYFLPQRKLPRMRDET